MNSNMVKPETFGHFHLVYHFTVPFRFLSPCSILKAVMTLWASTKFRSIGCLEVWNLFLLISTSFKFNVVLLILRGHSYIEFSHILVKMMLSCRPTNPVPLTSKCWIANNQCLQLQISNYCKKCNEAFFFFSDKGMNK